MFLQSVLVPCFVLPGSYVRVSLATGTRCAIGYLHNIKIVLCLVCGHIYFQVQSSTEHQFFRNLQVTCLKGQKQRSASFLSESEKIY